MRVITISRQHGSGGGQVGEILSRELGIPLYDKRLFSEAAKRSGIHPAFLKARRRMAGGCLPTRLTPL